MKMCCYQFKNIFFKPKSIKKTIIFFDVRVFLVMICFLQIPTNLFFWYKKGFIFWKGTFQGILRVVIFFNQKPAQFLVFTVIHKRRATSSHTTPHTTIITQRRRRRLKHGQPHMLCVCAWCPLRYCIVYGETLASIASSPAVVRLIRMLGKASSGFPMETMRYIDLMLDDCLLGIFFIRFMPYLVKSGKHLSQWTDETV